MSYLQFDKTRLVNLEYSLGIEYLRSNRAGSFASSTMVNCNTRKYHGLLICPLDNLDGGNHVLLSTLDETIIQHDKEFRFGVHRYPGKYHPAGHKYLRDFHTEPIPTSVYRVGGVILQKERLLAEHEDRVMIRYTLLDAHSPTKLRLQPFLAFRNVHTLSSANNDVNTATEEVQNGIRTKLYEGYPYLYMQLSKKNKYISEPNWYYNIEYPREKARGYDYREDLFVPGYFEVPLKKGESIVFSAALDEGATAGFKNKFKAEVKKRIPRNSFENCLENAAQQFFVYRDDRTEIIAGFPWMGNWARNTFTALPGLTLARGEVKTCKAVLDTMSSDLRGTLFQHTRNKWETEVNSADAPLWYFWAVQKYAEHVTPKTVWKNYGGKMQRILQAYKSGRDAKVEMHDNALIYAGKRGEAVTWMNAVVEGQPVTPRTGYAVEINALWYNALMFALEIANTVGENQFVSEWEGIAKKAGESFLNTFCDGEKGYLADYVDGEYVDWAIRPNQIFAASLPYSPLSEAQKYAVVENVRLNLLTPRGLRTLSPRHPDYKGVCAGDYISKDLAYHQGSAWPWLLGHFTEAYLKLHQKSGVHTIKSLYQDFEKEMWRHGIGTISEVFDGDPPYTGRGAIADAGSVGELIRIKYMLDQMENTKK